MRRSPFYGYANATLKLVVADEGELTTDPETGNVAPVTKIVEYRATLKTSSSKDDLKLREMAGVDAGSVFCKGWIVGVVVDGRVGGLDTAFLPEFCQLPLQVDATVDEQEGRLYILPRISSPFGVEEKTGQAISGFFSLGRGG